MAEYVIEVCGPNNECAAFAPIGSSRLRGRWDFAKVGHRDKSEAMKEMAMHLASTPIPGMWIILDTERRVGRVVDPLAETSDGQKILSVIQGVYRRHQVELGAPPQSQLPMIANDLSPDAIKTWAFVMATMVQCGQAVNVPGATPMPNPDVVRTWPGKRKADPHASGRAGKNESEWTDSVPVGKKSVAGANAAGADG